MIQQNLQDISRSPKDIEVADDQVVEADFDDEPMVYQQGFWKNE